MTDAIRGAMPTSPLVSVVLIFLDAAPYLDEAIASVLAQTYPVWELLLVDDGSTDGSTVIARRYAEQYPDKVRYLEHAGHRNLGMSASRNAGLFEARGAYLALLDADDIWRPHKLQEQVCLLEARPDVAMVYGATLYWYGWSGAADAPKDFVQAHRIRADVAYPPPSLVASYLTGAAAVPSPGSLLIRTAVARAVGGFDDAFRSLYEDQVFYAKVCLRHTVFVANACWDQYRQHPKSATGRAGLQAQVASRAKYLSWLAAYLREQGIEDAPIWRAVRLERWLATRPRLARLLDRMRHRIRRWRGPKRN
jgi:glycosyltransferase involved in cell wall biosynthesis